ncbi:hypothetical protein [Streptomyces sp. NRRL F-2799]|uniref:hypothetical protein n=1 Tax=Streptomyces sp. NRRL F-2799 TaxID=1463844 RepID=UPI0018FF0855|nr:hypothetical protein [Streptomyces sp. NRRL F-2799]
MAHQDHIRGRRAIVTGRPDALGFTDGTVFDLVRTAHQKGVIEGASGFRRGLAEFAEVVERRESALLAFLTQPRTVPQIAEHRLVYRPHVAGPHVDPVERRTATHHLVRLTAKGRVTETEPGPDAARGETVNRPLLFLDVDGPLNPYAAQPERRPDGYTTLRPPDAPTGAPPGCRTPPLRRAAAWSNIAWSESWGLDTPKKSSQGWGPRSSVKKPIRPGPGSSSAYEA